MRATIRSIEELGDVTQVRIHVKLEDGATYGDLKKLIEPSLPYPRNRGVVGIGCQPEQPVAGYALQRMEEIQTEIQAAMRRYEDMQGPIGMGVYLHKTFKMLETLLGELKT